MDTYVCHGGFFGHDAAGAWCTNPVWLSAPLVVLAAIVIVVLYVWGSNIWAWGQEKRREGGFFGVLFWIIASVIAVVGMFLGWTIGFIGALIILGTVIGWLLKGGK